MPGTNEAFAHINIDAQLKDQQANDLTKAEPVFRSPFAPTFDSNEVAEDPTREAGFG